MYLKWNFIFNYYITHTYVCVCILHTHTHTYMYILYYMNICFSIKMIAILMIHIIIYISVWYPGISCRINRSSHNFYNSSVRIIISLHTKASTGPIEKLGRPSLPVVHVSEPVRSSPGFGVHVDVAAVPPSGQNPADVLRIRSQRGTALFGHDGLHGAADSGKLSLGQVHPSQTVNHSQHYGSPHIWRILFSY